MEYTGRCLCGAVTYEAQPPTLFCAHCHCRWCRAAHGAAFVTWVGLSEARFRLTGGGERLRWYRSSEQSRRGFCDACGATLFYASSLCPGEIHVTRASLQGEIDRDPQVHCFYDQQAAWFTPGDDLPRFDSDADALAKFRAVSSRD